MSDDLTRELAEALRTFAEERPDLYLNVPGTSWERSDFAKAREALARYDEARRAEQEES